MKEEFLHFIWQHQLFENRPLVTSEGETVEIIQPGRHNLHAGPDFFDARLRIGDTLWAGNVEIHQRASDWNKHGHQNNAAYRNTILHVVAENDERVRNDIGAIVPAAIVRWPEWIEKNYESLVRSRNWVNCASQLYQIDPFRIRFFLNSIMIERLEMKIEAIEQRLAESKEEWNEIFYQFLSRSFGFRENNEPFERLARSLPQSILAKHHDSVFQIEALLYGQAGLLGNELFADEYYLQLRDEYHFLAQKYNLKPVGGEQWKFMRMHPVNFPTVRLSQFAALVYRSQGLFSAILDKKTIDEFRILFDIKASEYWDTHYSFNKPSPRRPKAFGEEAFRLIMINVVVPFLFLYGNYRNKNYLKDRALELLEKLPAENNRIIRRWKESGLTASNALESQALLHLQHFYCEPVRCLECTIGHRLILHRPT
jgi:hypothetical protein